MMITKNTLDFLAKLKENNTREWFLENKKWYEKSKKEVEGFLVKLIPELSKLDPSIQSPDIKDCMFRIFKDVRFSKDKSPYKTNFGAFVARGGRKTMLPGYYFHFEPGECFIAGGIYMPQPDVLRMVRNEIYFNSAEFKKILESKEFRKFFGKLGEFDKLKKAPKDFPADFPDIELLKYKSYIVSVNVPDEKVISAEYDTYALEAARAMLPLNAYINRAISNK
jgi:uncharacterized protein (TIGR02453 family)